MLDLLTPDEKSEIRKRIRERFDENPETYQDTIFAAVLNIHSVAQEKTITALQVQQLRQEMGLLLPNKKKDSMELRSDGLTPTQFERKRRLEANEKWRDKQNKNSEGEKMNMRMTEGQKSAIEKIVQEHTGGDKNMTAVELRDLVNSKNITDQPIQVHVINNLRFVLKKRRQNTFSPADKVSKKSNQAAVVKSKNISAGGSTSLKQVIDSFKSKRDKLIEIINRLEEVEALNI